MTQKIVSDWRSVPKGGDLKPEIIVMDPATGDPVRGDSGNPITYAMSVDAILSVEDGQELRPGDVVARIPREGAKTKDITGGLPRVAELFEARRPKDHAIIAESDGYVRFGKDYKNKRRITVEPVDETLTAVEYMIPKGKHIPVQEGDFVQKGDYIMDGNPAPHDILRIMGIEALANYMIDEVQDVYRLQGVKINDKHIEVIVRQMLQKFEILDGGDTTLLKGEQVEKTELDEENAKAVARGGREAKAEPVLLGITKASLQTRSFISAASFQETTRVLTEASVQGKRDKLLGLKENVIVGRLIPAGTGGATSRVKKIAADRDQTVIEARPPSEAETEAAALAAPLEVMETGDRHRSRRRPRRHGGKPRLSRRGLRARHPTPRRSQERSSGVFHCRCRSRPRKPRRRGTTPGKGNKRTGRAPAFLLTFERASRPRGHRCPLGRR